MRKKLGQKGKDPEAPNKRGATMASTTEGRWSQHAAEDRGKTVEDRQRRVKQSPQKPERWR